jgi:hypothetical protein
MHYPHSRTTIEQQVRELPSVAPQPILTAHSVSQRPVPLTIIKGAGHEFIPIPAGESAIVADFHSYVLLSLPYAEV